MIAISATCRSSSLNFCRTRRIVGATLLRSASSPHQRATADWVPGSIAIRAIPSVMGGSWNSSGVAGAQPLSPPHSPRWMFCRPSASILRTTSSGISGGPGWAETSASATSARADTAVTNIATALNLRRPVRRIVGSGPLDPHVVVVEGGATVRGALDRTGERVDALAAFEVRVGGDAFDDDDALLHALERLGRQHDLAALVAHAHPRPIGYAEACQVVRVHLDARLAVARLAGRHLVEGRVEIVARRAGGEAEGMAGVGILRHVPMVGQARHIGGDSDAVRARRGHVLPIWLETESLVRVAEALEVVRLLERRLAVDP